MQPVQQVSKNVFVHGRAAEGDSKLSFILLSHVANAFEMFVSLLS